MPTIRKRPLRAALTTGLLLSGALGTVTGAVLFEALRPALEAEPADGTPVRQAALRHAAPPGAAVTAAALQDVRADAPVLELAVASPDEAGAVSAATPPALAVPDSVAPIAPGPTTLDGSVGTPAADPAEAAGGPDPDTTRVVVRRGDTLLDILGRAGIGVAEAHSALTSLRALYDPRTLRPGQTIELGLDSGAESGDVSLASLSLGVDPANAIALTREDDGSFKALPVERELGHRRALVSGVIQSSLYESARRAGMTPALIAELMKIFSWDVDFQRDIRPGDRLEAVLDESLDADGEAVGDGRILFASLTANGQSLRAYRRDRPDGSSEYLDASGHPLRKWLLRTPIDGARLSSPFGMRRHPILGYSRMHKGVDFAAPTGTPIFAAGDGVVELIGIKSGYGKYIRLRHNRDYGTGYGHMSRFARGLHQGSRVQQGQVIGYVGATGLATGPHLHYEVLKDGDQINPMSLKTMVADALTGSELLAFETERAAVDRERAALEQERRLAAR